MDFSEVLEEIMARRQRKDIKSEINIVPFLDVLLVLVLIFYGNRADYQSERSSGTP